MSYQVIIAESAELDIRDSYLWYESQQDHLGDKFRNHIEDSINSIAQNPLSNQIRYKNVRVFSLKKFPFGIHFKIDEIKSTILILGVFHTSRNTKSWKSRP